MATSLRAGDVLAERYQMVDLLSETEGGWFWCAHDDVLQRQVAVHLIRADDERADALMTAAKRSAALMDRRNLRVLDADRDDAHCYVVNEWGQGTSLDNALADEGPLSPRRAAWLVAEVADTLAVAHDGGRAHGRLQPENVLVDENGQVRIIGFGVDAALHGLPPDRVEQDVRDLAALLYAALTGRWPGDRESLVPAAPREHDHPLRPRQVRAGIPRVLDQVCGEVLGEGTPGRNGSARAGLPGLGHRPTHDLTTAAGIRDALGEFLGDEATGSTAVPLAAAVAGPSGGADVPTEAGMPVFHDDDEVEWLRARGNPPPPPPALEEPPARPLFATDPEDGTPVRRPRPPRPAPSDGAEYWPWDTSTGHGGTGGSHSGLLPAVPPPDRVPGRRWLRLAFMVGLAALVLLAVAAAYQLGGRGDDEDDPDGDAARRGGPSAGLTAFQGVEATDFDPEGSPPQDENPELTPYAVDGDPATSWITSSYRQQFGPGGLKDGVGLTLDLGEVKGVRLVEIQVGGGTTTAEVHLREEPPTAAPGDEPVGGGTDDDTIVVELDEAQQARYVTVWLTAIPPVDADFRGEIREIVVSG
ncbi:protein kinase family protein [Nocardioides solisilvae]|uniref:protein kinase family protein n=1 Tax=Nocardioides solisilvae TaxID=1542435 RepID=UPI000D7425CE|nr:protein kinase family protein [Nocardioides solisilvae]